mmetsp:Transcript_91593/g.259304  ORF Transcript_91593/g.259304 Transcript_91593/m.259304 type:complete len:229 (-) Transcript_91593:153-839(-)
MLGAPLREARAGRSPVGLGHGHREARLRRAVRHASWQLLEGHPHRLAACAARTVCRASRLRHAAHPVVYLGRAVAAVEPGAGGLLRDHRQGLGPGPRLRDQRRPPALQRGGEVGPPPDARAAGRGAPAAPHRPQRVEEALPLAVAHVGAEGDRLSPGRDSEARLAHAGRVDPPGEGRGAVGLGLGSVANPGLAGPVALAADDAAVGGHALAERLHVQRRQVPRWRRRR